MFFERFCLALEILMIPKRGKPLFHTVSFMHSALQTRSHPEMGYFHFKHGVELQLRVGRFCVSRHSVLLIWASWILCQITATVGNTTGDTVGDTLTLPRLTAPAPRTKPCSVVDLRVCPKLCQWQNPSKASKAVQSCPKSLVKKAKISQSEHSLAKITNNGLCALGDQRAAIPRVAQPWWKICGRFDADANHHIVFTNFSPVWWVFHYVSILL